MFVPRKEDFMNFTDEAVQYLARQMGERAVANREELETRFLPLIRVVLRTGHGRPALVHWLEQHLPRVAPTAQFPNAVDAERVAPRMARLLCAELLQKAQTEMAGDASRETVLGG
jgi:predicted signal transduction protein with EAL and GGDEF domain